MDIDVRQQGVTTPIEVRVYVPGDVCMTGALPSRRASNEDPGRKSRNYRSANLDITVTPSAGNPEGTWIVRGGPVWEINDKDLC